MPHIRALYINIPLNARFDTESTEFSSTVPLALSELLRLEELNIPPSWLTSSMTKALSSLPVLDSIDAIDMWDLVPNGAILPSPADLLVPSDFPCLRELHAPITLRRALSWLQRVSSSRFMIQLSLLSPERESKATYMSILQYVSDNMSSCIELFDLEITKIVDPQKSRSTIQLFDLKPIFACKKLESLELCFPFPFDISVEEIILIIQSLPSLKELILNPSPSNTLYHKPSIHISCLSTLARSPPSQSLEILGLYVDTSSTQLPSFNEDLSLANLERLDLGYSSLSASSVEGGIVNERWQRVETLLELELRAGK
ncbi:hypothetical protein ONZ45_g16194 [Pleurotus djamor]|nr:hypothetical protein ONZ45_g16194 [Pleurotus djamor]